MHLIISFQFLYILTLSLTRKSKEHKYQHVEGGSSCLHGIVDGDMENCKSFISNHPVFFFDESFVGIIKSFCLTRDGNRGYFNVCLKFELNSNFLNFNGLNLNF